jgi:hypothetical protein
VASRPGPWAGHAPGDLAQAGELRRGRLQEPTSCWRLRATASAPQSPGGGLWVGNGTGDHGRLLLRWRLVGDGRRRRRRWERWERYPEAAGAAVSETLCACSIACAYPSRSRVTKRGLSRPFPRRIIHNLANLARSAHLAHLGPWVVLVWRTESSSMNYSSSRLF